MEENKKSKGLKKKGILIAALLLLAGFFAVKVLGGDKSASYKEVTAENRDIISYLEFSGHVEAVNSANVYAQATARISEVLVKEGDYVRQGDVLAVLDSDDVEYNIQLKELALAQTVKNNDYNVKDSRNNLDNLNQQIGQGMHSGLNSAEKALLSAQQSYLDAVEKYNKTKADYEAGKTDSIVSARQTMISQQVSYEAASKKHDEGKLSDEDFATYEVNMNNAMENYDKAKERAKDSVEDARDAMEDAKDAFENAQRDYETAELSVEQNVAAYENTLEKAQALSTVETSEAELEHLKESLRDYTICAPIDGYITNLTMKTGDYTSNAMAVAEVTDFDLMQVAIKIDEYDSSSVKEGDPVEIYMDAQKLTYAGRISRISRVATVQNGVSYLEAIVEFDADDQVYSGFSAEVKLIKAEERGVCALPVEDISYDEYNTAYVLKKGEGKEPVKQPVTLGASDGVWVQIREGLEAGDVILVTPTLSLEEMMEMRAQMMAP